jgi:enamine deaminase RidA (YjgF/YER057c/UK114 family)
MGAEDRIKELGLELPVFPAQPAGTVNAYGANNIPAVRVGNLLYIGGLIGPGPNNGAGKLGADCTIEQGYAAARESGLRMLSRMRTFLGDLDQVVQVVKVLAFVNSTQEFTDQPRVANGFSDLIVDVFGEPGRHARSAIGVASLPNGAPVEVEAIFEVK